MEAANRGASESGDPSIGLNIDLPREQLPNAWIAPELALRFHYFALRKMHFMLRARALVAFPGGFGTLDELFEALTLVQTGKIPRIPDRAGRQPLLEPGDRLGLHGRRGVHRRGRAGSCARRSRPGPRRRRPSCATTGCDRRAA